MAECPILVDTLIHCRWLIPIIPQKTVLPFHSVAVLNGKIVALLPTSEASILYKAEHQYHLSEDHVLIPGFVNVHCHSSMSLLRGFADDVQLEDWLMHYIWPAEQKWVSEEFVKVGSYIAVSELIRAGVTCVNDMVLYIALIADLFPLSLKEYSSSSLYSTFSRISQLRS